MKLNIKTTFGAVCVLLTLASTQVLALTLGPIRGGVQLGKELDVSVTVQFAADEDVSSACFIAEVSFGESTLGRSQVTVQSQPGRQPNTQLIRLTSGPRVDEAVATVILTATCGAKASRRYVLLAELLSEPGVADTPVIQTAAALVVAAPNRAADAQPLAAVVAPSAQPQKPSKPRTAITKPTISGGASAQQKAERDAATRAAGEMHTAALEDLQRRVDVITTWQASSSLAEELLKSQAREKALETDIQGLRVVTAKNQQNLLTVAAALEESEARNYSNFLVYALGALLAACLGAVAFAYSRLRRGASDASPWWSGGGERIAGGGPQPEPLAGKMVIVPVGAPVVAKPEAADQASAVDVPKIAKVPIAAKPVVDDLSDDGAWSPAPAVTLPIPVVATKIHLDKPESAPLATPSAKAINTQEMLDVRQQAEFFMALGQHDDAVKLLVSSISTSNEANPLVYLDLLRIFHTLSRRADFERYRTDFNLQFTGRIPEYASFLMEGNGLESYDDICQQIVVLWPTDYTVDFIEQCLVRLSEDDPEQGIDLEAFKDLLLLYGVLKRLDQTQDSAVIPFSATRNASPQMMAASGSTVSTPDTLEGEPPLPVIGGAEAAAPSTDVDLDIDVDLDLDLADETPQIPTQATPAPSDNLINFDMSGFELPAKGKPPDK